MTAASTWVRARCNADDGIARMRTQVAEVVGTKHVVVGVNGSFARREATSGSDVDLFLLVETGDDLTEGRSLLHSLKDCIRDAGFKLPSNGGVFDEPLAFAALCETIGGQDDMNITITRRMLLLLEGEWLHGQATFDSIRSELVERYVGERMREEQIALFLLNDIIRYWRTICVDYEHKINLGKAQEIRLLKLRFSRMLLYMGGLVAVGATHGLSAQAKRVRLMNLLAMPPADRIREVVGGQCDEALDIYEEFLTAIDEPSRRAVLETPRMAGDYSEEYKALRTRAKAFRDSLRRTLEKAFPEETHPLLSAVLL